MEKEILREMVLDRNKKMKLLLRKVQFQVDRIDSMDHELEQLRRKVAQERLDREEELSMLIESRLVVEEVLARLGNDLQQQGSLHRYAEVVKKQASPTKTDSSYVVKMQSQLCKAMHTAGITDHYLVLVRAICDTEIKFLEDARKQIVERMSNTELELLNLIVAKDQECRALEATQNSRLESERLMIEKIRNMLCRDDEDEDTDDHGADKEESLEETEETEEEVDDDDDDDEEEDAEEGKEQDIYFVTGNVPYMQGKQHHHFHSKPKEFLDPVCEDDDEGPVNGHADC